MAETVYNQFTSFVNQAAGIAAGDTEFQLLNTDLFPVPGDTYRIGVDAEIMMVTANVAGLLTVERGLEGTVDSAHTNGAGVVTVVTAGAILALVGGGGGGGGVSPCGAFGCNFAGGVTVSSVPLQVEFDGNQVYFGGASFSSAIVSDGGIIPGTAGVYCVVAVAQLTGSVVGQCTMYLSLDGNAQDFCYFVQDANAAVAIQTMFITVGATDEIGVQVLDNVGGSTVVSQGTMISVWRVD